VYRCVLSGLQYLLASRKCRNASPLPRIYRSYYYWCLPTSTCAASLRGHGLVWHRTERAGWRHNIECTVISSSSRPGVRPLTARLLIDVAATPCIAPSSARIFTSENKTGRERLLRFFKCLRDANLPLENAPAHWDNAGACGLRHKGGVGSIAAVYERKCTHAPPSPHQRR
jgi:hypothetical protein